MGDTIRATTVSCVFTRNFQKKFPEKKIPAYPHGSFIMVSVMPPSGVGGLPGFNPGHHDISLASRYNHLAVMQDTPASYYQFTGVASAQEQMAQTRSMPAPIARKIMEPTRGRSRGKTMPQSIGKTMPQSIGKTMPQSMAAPPTVTSANDLSAVNSKPKICDQPGCKGIH